MRVSWSDWAARSAEMDPGRATEGLKQIGLAYRAANQSVKIPLQAGIRQLPEILTMVRLAEDGGKERSVARYMSWAPADLRLALLEVQNALGISASTAPQEKTRSELHHGPLGYYINLDERGEFFADVRDQNDVTIFEVRSEEDGSIGLIEDGYMAHKKDLEGLCAYLAEVGLVHASADLLPSDQFEMIEPCPEMEI